MVSRRPLESNVDRGADHCPVVYRGIGADHNVYWGPVGLAMNILCLYANGIGVDSVMNPIHSYNVNIVHSQSAEAAAAGLASWSLVMSATTALVIPSIECIGVIWTNTVAAVFAVIGQGISFAGSFLDNPVRGSSIGVGFSTMENN